jgi:hypothetical protein
MRIGVIVFEQPDLEPAHFISKSLREQFLSLRHNGKRAVIPAGENLLKIVVNLTFGKIKALLRNFKDHAPRYNLGKPFIPERLPSHKVPGTKAIGHVAEQSANCRATIRLANHLGRIPQEATA